MVSIKDIAQACGVSTATVSKALNNRDDVNPATRERVRETAKALGYLPNAMARALKTNKTYNIGVLMVDKADSGLKHHYFASILDSFKVVMERSGYDLTFISNQIGNQTWVVSVDYVSDGKYAVASDNEAGMRDAVLYALRRGHKRLALIYGEPSQVTEIRKKVFFETLAAHQQEFQCDAEFTDPVSLQEMGYVVEGKYLHPELAYQLTQAMLADPQEADRKLPTCIIYPDDICAVAGMAAIQDAGLTPGQEVSVIGYDGHPVLRMLGPHLTTIRQDTEQIGIKAAELMLKMLRKEDIPPTERVRSCSGRLLEGDTVADLNKK